MMTHSRISMRTGAVALTAMLAYCAAFGQQSASYSAAAQLYRSNAARCGNPAGAACMRNFANYYNCLSRDLSGASCGATPTCNTSCVGGGSAGVGSFAPTMLTPNASNASQQVGNAINLGIQLFQMFHSNRPAAQPDANAAPASDPAAIAAAKQQAINAEAVDLLQQSDALLPSLNPSAAPPPPTPPDPNATLDSLLDDGPPANTSNSEISALLGGNDQAPPDPSSGSASDSASAIANLLSNNSPTDSSGNASAPSATLPSATEPPLPAYLAPQDPQTNAALQQSVDQPDTTETASLPQEMQGGDNPPSDGLSGLVAPVKSLISSVENDPIVQWVMSDKGGLTTMPLPAAGDDPEAAYDKVAGQSVVGFGDLLKGVASGPIGWAKGLYNYGTKMTNQMGADIGLANASVFGSGNEESQ